MRTRSPVHKDSYKGAGTYRKKWKNGIENGKKWAHLSGTKRFMRLLRQNMMPKKGVH